MTRYLCAPAIIVVLVASGVASAEPATTNSLMTPAAPTLKTPLAVWAGAVAADQITTYWFSSQYGDQIREANPLIRPLDRHPFLLVATGAAIDAASGWAAFRFLGPRHPTLAKIVFYGAAGYRAYLAAHNIRMMRLANGMRSAPPIR